MTQTISSLSTNEAELLAALAAAGLVVFRYAEAAALWTSTTSLPKALSKLERGGWLKRLERELYMLVPLEAGPERTWSEDSLLIGAKLVEPSAIAYWSALRFWNFTEQVPSTVFVQSPRRKLHATLVIDNMRYRVVHLRNERFFGIVQRMSVRRHIPITDREKTVIDALDRPDLCGGIRHLAVALLDRCTQIDWDKVDNYLHRFASGAVYKRLGYVVEAFDLPLPQRDDHLARWQSNLTAGIAELDPSEPGPGRNHMRWRIRDNIMLDSLNPRTFHDS